MVTFRKQDRDRVVAGEITVTFRLWTTAKVKAGKMYRTGIGTLAVDDVAVIPAALVSEDDVARTGCADIPAIWQLAGEHTKTHVGPETLLYRVEFRYLGDVAPEAPAPALDAEAIAAKLERMDRNSPRGPWTQMFLKAIGDAPEVPARVLAAELDWPRLDFKAHVRKLKALGLTISHEVGYELTDAGRRQLRNAVKLKR